MYWGKGYPAAFNPLLWKPCQEPLLFFRKLFPFSLVKKLRAKCPINLSKRPLWLLVAELCTFGLAPSHSFFFFPNSNGTWQTHPTPFRPTGTNGWYHSGSSLPGERVVSPVSEAFSYNVPSQAQLYHVLISQACLQCERLRSQK